MCEKHLGITPFVVGPGARTGMRILMKNPSEVGADRIVNGGGGASRAYGGPCIVADFGTATTFDVVSAEGEYARRRRSRPGIEVSLEALTTRAAKLIKVELAEPEHAIGKSTTEALQSGAVYTAALAAELPVPVIASGDVDGRAAALALLESGAAAVMLARHAIGRPWLFREILDDAPPPDPSARFKEARRFADEVLTDMGPRAVGHLRQFWPRFRRSGALDKALAGLLMEARSEAEIRALLAG